MSRPGVVTVLARLVQILGPWLAEREQSHMR